MHGPKNPQQTLCPLVQMMLASQNVTLPGMRRIANFFSYAMTLESNVRQNIELHSSSCAILKRKKTEKETGAYGHIRPSSFGMPRYFIAATCGHHRWAMGEGLSSRLAQAADSLSGERFHTLPPACFNVPPGASLFSSLNKNVALISCGLPFSLHTSFAKPHVTEDYNSPLLSLALQM